MKIVPAVEQELRRAIREERAKDPLIPITKLQENLERHFNRTFAREYLTKLSEKVARQTLVELDRARLKSACLHPRELPHDERRLLKVVHLIRDGNRGPAPSPHPGP